MLFILHPSAFILAFHPQVRKPLGRVSFSIALRRAGELKMIRLNTRKNTRDKSRERKTNFERFSGQGNRSQRLSFFFSTQLGQASTSITGEMWDENGARSAAADIRLRSRSGVQSGTATLATEPLNFEICSRATI